MDFDDFAKFVGYLTIGWWVLMIIIFIIIMIMGKTTATKEKLAGYLATGGPHEVPAPYGVGAYMHGRAYR